MKCENDMFKIEKFNEDLVNLEEVCNVLKVQWESECEVVLGIQQLKEELE